MNRFTVAELKQVRPEVTQQALEPGWEAIGMSSVAGVVG
jgi:hypothetical protein